MTNYKAPLRDMRFTLFELLDFEGHYQSLPGCEEASLEMINAIMEESAKFSENVLSPLYRIGDEEGCHWIDGEVSTPSGFKDAYEQYVEAGWPSMTCDPEYGGQGLPASLGSITGEMRGTANWAWGMYPGLSQGAMNTIGVHGTEAQKQTYLTKLVEGSWTGTMCLTESHCGTDLGLMRTKAEPNGDDSYNITGTKIFISAGEHDMAENIVHIVLARLPGSPTGTRGISLFIVPKFNLDSDGKVADRNQVRCGSIEQKMGIHGNATCVMNFDGARGFLIGEEHKGLLAMFTFMNTARIGTAIQGLAHTELGFQKSLAYAKDRLQMRSISGVKNPDGAADPIIVHPDVRRMLLTQKAFAEGGRMLIYFASKQVDIMQRAESEEQRKHAEDLLSFMTPIAKGFLTEVGFESANLGVQCFGGHGFIREWGAEQNVRDCRISMLYEGTTGIQALDLVGRKVLGSGGELLKNFTKIVHQFCRSQSDNAEMQRFVEPLAQLNGKWGELTLELGTRSMNNADEAGGGAVDYLMFSGYTILAYLWATAALKSQQTLVAGSTEEAFYRAKLETAKFYYERILPRTQVHETVLLSGVDNLMGLAAEDFQF